MQGRAPAETEAPAAASPAQESEILQRFDTDKDGALSGEEFLAARKTLAEEKPDKQPHAATTSRSVFDAPSIIKRYDTDGDGKLSDDEKTKARDAQKKRYAETIQRYDKDGDGELNDAEKQAARSDMRKHWRERMMQKYDTDGDGTLSDEEKAAIPRRYKR